MDVDPHRKHPGGEHVPKLATRMRSLGITTVGELAHAPKSALEAAWGRDDTPLVPYHRRVDAKSMGHEVTLAEDCADREFIEGTMLRLSDQVARRLRGDGYTGRIVTVKLRNRRFETRIRQRALGGFTDDHTRIFEVARELLRANWKGDPLRLIGISVSGLERRAAAPQAELFDSGAKSRRWREALDRVRDRLGEASLVPAGSLTHRRELGHVPFGAVKRGR